MVEAPKIETCTKGDHISDEQTQPGRQEKQPEPKHPTEIEDLEPDGQDVETVKGGIYVRNPGGDPTDF